MKPTDLFERFAASLIGLPISHVWRGYGSFLSVEFGKLEPVAKRDGTLLQPQGEVSLGIEWSWRIEDQAVIRCGSWSEEHIWETAFDALRNAQVASCELFGALPEVILTTVSGIRLITFSTTDGQPQWDIVDRRDAPPSWYNVRQGKLYVGDGREPVV